MGSSKEEIVVADADPIQEVEAAREAFEREFGRFAHFIEQGSDAAVSLKEAEAEQRALVELRTKHLGKKGAIAAA